MGGGELGMRHNTRAARTTVHPVEEGEEEEEEEDVEGEEKEEEGGRGGRRGMRKKGTDSGSKGRDTHVRTCAVCSSHLAKAMVPG